MSRRQRVLELERSPGPTLRNRSGFVAFYLVVFIQRGVSMPCIGDVMKRSLRAWIFPVLLLCVVGAHASDDTASAQAQTASRAWLAYVDAGNYAKSWDESAALFRHEVTKPDWEHAVGATRQPLGKLTERKLESATYTKRLPGVPDGDYVVITYRSSFTNRPIATETVTPMLDADGQWRVAGYFVK
jgi:hypothetical protein